MALQGLCMTCRETSEDGKSKPTMQNMENVKVEEKNNRYSAKGNCAQCGGNMFKFMSKDDAQQYI